MLGLLTVLRIIPFRLHSCLAQFTREICGSEITIGTSAGCQEFLNSWNSRLALVLREVAILT